MSQSATITYAQTGVHAPVYVVTSLSDPPWKPLEMKVEQKQTASANKIFTRRFDNVPVGDYQYKIRIGHGHWVVDESKDTATDQQGNRNNVIHVKAGKHGESRKPISESFVEKLQAISPLEKAAESHLIRKDSITSSNGHVPEPSVPVPAVVVDKVVDKAQPTYGDTKPHALTKNDAKRAADFRPDLEKTHEKAVVNSEVPKSSSLPLLVVEKTDNKPAYGDDFGDRATTSQKVAYDMRSADAQPNKLIITPEGHVEPGTEEEQAAPLFRHESVQLDEPPKKSPSTSALDTIEEGSIDSSTEVSSSSKDVFNTPSDSNESSQYEDSFKKRSVFRDASDTPSGSEFGHGQRFAHETESAVDDDDELDNAPLLSHETELHRNLDLVDDEGDYEEVESADNDDDELNNGPLLSHETGLNGKTVYPDEDENEEVDELDFAPLLSHETGFQEYSDSATATNDDVVEDDISEPRHYAYDDDDEGCIDRTLQPDEAPTFSHEEADIDEDEYDEDDAPLLPHERDSAIADESCTEDDAEPTFPYEDDNARNMYGGTGRSAIFRGRTNSSNLPHRLPRTDADDENLNDPSLERFPTNREQILQRVATIGLQLPEDEAVEEDLHSPGMSVMSQACSSIDLAPVKSYASLASVPEVDDSDEDKDEGEVESPTSPTALHMALGPRDFARDPLAVAEKRIGHDDHIPDQVHETPTSIVTNDQNELRHRNVRKQDDSPRDISQSLDQPNETFLQNFLRVVFGSLGRLLTACVGDRKRAGAAVMVAGVAVACYVFAWA